ncbi:GntR family transcriptional regulator [Streptomyces sp. NBC_01808]|uniref:GntR family transcriptional regulator n=1 Tax=Streptomyces sp. NBC_01808 TaxID=2975947 RepID=UPI002DDA57B1|nr:GntR family transcriptional regulator [Streptomyces sp. NBC_01808]WSA36273.1 GntR family transcriptional regulator [Streptomyces sp. NBC_01808]
MALHPLSSGSLADQVADALRDAILEGRYPPGTRLVERTIAAELGVSHIPVREALSRLADEGLTERTPRRGSRVATLTARELDELSTLRIVLEQFVVARVGERMTPRTERELRRIVEAMHRAAADGNFRRVFDLDQRFHERLWELADHRMLNELVTQLRSRIGAFLRAATAALPPERLEQHAASHDVLLDALLDDDPETGRAEMARHIEAAATRIRASLPEPDGDADD